MRKIAKIMLKTAAAFAGVVALFFAFSNFWILSHKAVSDIGRVVPREYGLLLGTSKFTRSGMVNPYYRYRIVAAAELFKAGKIKKIIVSGDNSTKYYNEPSTMRDDLVALGVPEKNISLDFAGLRTFDSVARCKSMFGISDPVIITQEYHACRALFLAEQLGLDGALAYAAKTPQGEAYIVRNEIRESFARVRAVIDALFGAEAD